MARPWHLYNNIFPYDHLPPRRVRPAQYQLWTRMMVMKTNKTRWEDHEVITIKLTTHLFIVFSMLIIPWREMTFESFRGPPVQWE